MKLPRVTFETSENLSIGLLPLEGVQVENTSPDFKKFEEDVFHDVHQAFDNLALIAEDDVFRSYRDLYWRHGMDPTKIRVSSEALVRRIVKGENLWRISNVVDTANLASAKHTLPVGLIDCRYIDGDLTIRIAKKGEIFQRIGGKEITCRGRELVLADENKIVCFGFASYDSHITRIRKSSRDILLLIYGAPIVTEKKMNSSLKITKEIIEQWVKCEFKDPKIYWSKIK